MLGSGRVLSQDEVTQVLLQVKGRIKGTAKRDDVDEVANTIFDAIPENERLAMVSYLDVVTTKSQQTTALKMVEYYNELAKRPVDFSTLRRDCHVVLKKTLVTHGTTTTTLVDFLQSSQGAQLVPDEKLRNRLIELSNNPEALSQNEKEDCELLAQHPETVSLLLQIGQANIGKLQAALWTGFHEMYAEKDPSAALRSRGVRWNMTLLNSGAVVIETNVTYSFQQLGEEPKKLLEMDLNIKRELELKSGKVKQSSISLRNPTIAQEVSAAEKKKRIFLNFIKQTQDFASQIE